MAKPVDSEQMQTLLAKVPEDRLYYPLVFADGELKAVGSAEYYQILHIVRELIDA
jgi:disulfide oxidoreductase YuzD